MVSTKRLFVSSKMPFSARNLEGGTLAPRRTHCPASCPGAQSLHRSLAPHPPICQSDALRCCCAFPSARSVSCARGMCIPRCREWGSSAVLHLDDRITSQNLARRPDGVASPAPVLALELACLQGESEGRAGDSQGCGRWLVAGVTSAATTETYARGGGRGPYKVV